MMLEIIHSLERQTSKKVGFACSDGGIECTKQNIDKEFCKPGITSEFTAAYRPESNGVAEHCSDLPYQSDHH